jgi:hypothetical protein
MSVCYLAIFGARGIYRMRIDRRHTKHKVLSETVIHLSRSSLTNKYNILSFRTMEIKKCHYVNSVYSTWPKTQKQQSTATPSKLKSNIRQKTIYFATVTWLRLAFFSPFVCVLVDRVVDCLVFFNRDYFNNTNTSHFWCEISINRKITVGNAGWELFEFIEVFDS